MLIAEGSLAIDTYANALRLNVEKIYTIEQARSTFARSLQLQWMANGPDQNTIDKLTAILQDFKGGQCPLELNYQSPIAKAMLRLGDEWRLHAGDELVVKLRALFGKENVEIKYR